MTIQSTLIATALGILTAVLAAYFLNAPARQDLAARPGVNETVAEQAIPFDVWPICSSMASLDSDFAAGKRAMVAGDWNAAIKALTSAGLRDARNADIQNYLGYVYRRLRQFDRAMHYYERALALNPRHRSAHEHLGEAFLVQGDLAKASEHLAALERICLIPCEEHDDLKQAIAEHSKLAKR
jgi:tetratricopeptide (TPR) repeat protein